MNASKKGLFLLNLGTPESPSTKDVRKYLDEFLNDPYVIDIPKVLRKILVNGIILNTRPKKSAEAYQQIWTKDGSPLMIHTRELTEKVRQVINRNRAESERVNVKMGMRYGKPSITETLQAFKKDQVEEIVFLPLYPQYSYAASESSLAEFERVRQQVAPEIKVKTIEDFFNDPRFIHALADSMKEAVARFKPDVLLLSYHGIPERQIAKIKNAPKECCTPGCCDQWDQRNLQCYRAQCYETSRLLAKELGLPIEKVVTSFQSRLGRTKWIEPYTDFLLKDFPGQGVKRILVASPSFTADCLETLEEIRIRYDELFKESGGQEFEYIPCLNSRDDFAEFVASLAQERSSQS
jgi:ferrochelatase